MEYREPPEIKKIVIDDEIFHDLFHPLWACKGYPGGPRRHLKYAWEFKWRSMLRARTLCLIGLHQVTQCWAPKKHLTRTACMNCARKMSEWQPY